MNTRVIFSTLIINSVNKINLETKAPPFTPFYDRNALNIDELVLMSRK